MLVNQGLRATLRTAFGRAALHLRTRRDSSAVPSPDAASAMAVHPFDDEFNVDTSGLIWGEHLASGHANDQWSTAYYGVPPSVFCTVMDRIHLSIAGAAFVDMGSGKGRGVMLASRFPFASIHGVELSPSLHAIAEANLTRMRKLHPGVASVHLHNMDATAFIFPPQPLVLFFYHPFCKPVLDRVLQNLRNSLLVLPRAVHIIYINAELKRVLDQSPFLTKVFEETLPMRREDQLADRVGSSVEECAIYVNTETG